MKSGDSLDPAIQWAQEEYLAKDLFLNSREASTNEVRRVILSTVDEMIKQTNQEIPFDPRLIAPLRRIKRIMEIELSVDAILIPETDGFTVKINSALHPFKKRYAIAHEIGHTFFFNIEATPPRREFEYQKSGYWVQEEFSCAIAREILVPRFSLLPLIQNERIQPSVNALRYLSAFYQVSFDVLRMRLINDVRLWDCVVLKSSVIDGKILTKGRDISKGRSYRSFVMPRVIEAVDRYPELLHIMLATLREKRIKDAIKVGNRKYLVETLLLDAGKQTVMSLLLQS
jgi:hypothetical protein